VNQIPLEYEPRGACDLFIPKKLRISHEDRFMTFREIIESGAGRFLKGSQFDDMGIEVVENTSDEVLELAIEMEQRLTGEWQDTDIDQDLQRRYWALFNGHKTSARIGSHFLSTNRYLLEI
jgi:putative glycosyltransferase (TIGR04372 family)